MKDSRIKYTLFVLNASLNIALFLVVYVLFFLLMGINNPQIINLSRTAAVALVSFTLLLFIMNSIYGWVDLSNKSNENHTIMAIMSVIFTDIFAYFILQIMNVNPANNQHLILFGKDFPLLILCIVLQTIWIVSITLITSKIYNFLFPPSRSCIISFSQNRANYLFDKFTKNKSSYNICDVAHYNYDKINDVIDRNNTIIIDKIPKENFSVILANCYKKNKNILMATDIENLIISSSSRTVIDDFTLLRSDFVELSVFQSFVKRTFDIVLSLFLLIILLPLMIVCAIIVKLYDKGPIFFKQLRLKKDEKVFNIIKFRTMIVDIDKKSKIISPAYEKDSRITKPGAILRKLRLDELPQLINILLGDMSFVGPRPEMFSAYPKILSQTPAFKYRLKVKCGLTGLAQIEGKYNTPYADKLLLDLLYIENFSLLFDLKLIFRTLTVFFRKDSTEGLKINKSKAPEMLI